MTTLPLTYECARKQGTLDKLSFKELINCDQCVREKVDFKEDITSCQICFRHLEGDETTVKSKTDDFMACYLKNYDPPLVTKQEKPVSVGKAVVPPEDYLDDFYHDTRLPKIH